MVLVGAAASRMMDGYWSPMTRTRATFEYVEGQTRRLEGLGGSMKHPFPSVDLNVLLNNLILYVLIKENLPGGRLKYQFDPVRMFKHQYI